MRRREFIAGLGGAAAAWPLAAHAQEKVRRIGVVSAIRADDLENQQRLTAFRQAMQQLGWTEGGNISIEYRLGGDSVTQARKDAAEMVALAPDVILANGSLPVAQLLQATRTIPIVFVQVNDPVSSGYVQSLARPGGNATGFSLIEFGVVGKWLELIKQVAPGITRIAALRSPQTPSGITQVAAMQAVAPNFGVTIHIVNVTGPDDIERGIADAAQHGNVGIIMTTSAPMIQHRDLIIGIAVRRKLPTIFPYRFFAAAGGLMSYGNDAAEAYRGAANYVDRILKGEKPADLPVQQPTAFHLAVNLKTATALGIAVPPSLLATATEVFE